MDIGNNNRSVFLLNYHLVLCIKHRKRVIDEAISDRLKELFIDISSGYGITLVSWNHDLDYIYLSFKAKPNSELSKMINAYKSASSRKIKREFTQIKQFLYDEYFWSRSYCLVSTGCIDLEVIEKYIESQGKLGKKVT